MVWQRAHIRTVNRPSTAWNGPVEFPQNEQCGPTPLALLLERVFARSRGRLAL